MLLVKKKLWLGESKGSQLGFLTARTKTSPRPPLSLCWRIFVTLTEEGEGEGEGRLHFWDLGQL